LAELITREQGKTMADARGDVFRGLEVVEFACGIPSLLQGETLPNVATQVDLHSIRVPLGVCAGIAPFNFPAMIPLWMFPIAIACGNTFILKPSERVPLTAMRLVELAEKAGLPNGVLNIVQGTKDTVNFLCDHPQIKSISFVGGNQAGQHIYSRASATGKRAQVNMGAKNHAVVLPDADPISVVNQLVGAGTGAAGQRCMATSVAVFVGDSHHLIPKIVEACQKLKVGPGGDTSTDIGPVISQAAKDRIEELIECGVHKCKADLLLDGRNPKVADEYAKGYYVGPTVFDHVKPSMRIYQEEIFGPVLLCVRVKTLDEAIQLVNANPYGNGCGVFTRSGGVARKFVDEIECGQVGVNLPIPVPLPMFSFTGNKASMWGSHNFYGKAGVQFFTQLKTITSSWKDDSHVEELNMSMPKL
jgi:malonate-semialdehyde dehydrogenase (acetylating)/methylmalonate-semialdehyde dehydrogenase